MRYVGCQSHGVRLPIITQGDNLPKIVVESTLKMAESLNIEIKENDIIGVTEAIVAKAQGNYANIKDVACDIKEKFQDEAVGVVFPILSRNRFLNMLKGIAMGAKKVYVLLQYPSDEVGNPMVDYDNYDEIEDKLKGLLTAEEFKKIVGDFKHPFTDMDYISLYESVSPNIEVYLSDNSRDILKLTKNVLVAEIHTRERTARKLKMHGAEKVYTLSDILTKSFNGSGYNENYGLLGSNLSKGDTLKLFPRDCDTFIKNLEDEFKKAVGISPQLLIYGDGAYKDPAAKIWELADPVVSPAHTERLKGSPNEIKFKYVADNVLADLAPEDKTKAMNDLIKEKSKQNNYNEGTTPRKYADLLGSLCDLMSGSGDKGTPVIMIRGYFDDYSDN